MLAAATENTTKEFSLAVFVFSPEEHGGNLCSFSFELDFATKKSGYEGDEQKVN
jgi:hypothetical protein